MNRPLSLMNLADVNKKSGYIQKNRAWGNCCDHEILNKDLLKMNQTLMD